MQSNYKPQDYKLPYRRALVKTLTRKDTKIAIAGNIVKSDMNTNMLVLNDGFNEIQVKVTNNTKFTSDFDLSKNKLVRIFGKIAFYEDNTFDFVADIIQNIAGLNLELYNKFLNNKKA
jgi:uncharacterized protein YdeI (BOF family)